VTTGGVSRDPANPFVRRTAIQAEASAFSIFDPSADVVYIGAVIDGNSVADQSFRPILANRAPLDITIDLTSIRGSPTATIADPTRYSNAQQAVRSIISQGVSAAIPAGATQELCAQFRFATDGTCRLDVGSGFGSLSSAGAVTFGNATLRLGAHAVGNEGHIGLERVLVLRGSFTLAECQAVDW